MQSSILTAVFLPAALGVIMLGLGLSLTIADFKRVIVYPRAVVVGLACQMLLMPLLCFFIAKGFALAPALAVGLMLLAASPGGATANLFSHLMRGDVALNITLTAVNSVLTLFTLPLIVNLALQHFLARGQAIPLVFDKIAQVFAIVLVPVGLGMLLRSRRPQLAQRLDRPVRGLSVLFLFLIIVGVATNERAHVADHVRQVGLAALCFNLVSLFLGYVLPRLIGLPKKQAISIGIEIGIHNATLAITIAMSPALLNNPTMAVPSAVYGVIMMFTATAFGVLVNLGRTEAEPGNMSVRG